MINKVEYKSLLESQSFDKLESKLDEDINILLNNILKENTEESKSEMDWYKKLELIRNLEPKIMPILEVYEDTIINDEYNQMDRINNYIQTYSDIEDYIQYKDIF